MTSLYVTKDARYSDTFCPTPRGLSLTRPRRIGTTLLMKTELVETRGDHDRVRDEVAGECDKGTADNDRPGGYQHPWSAHTNGLYPLRTYQTETIHTCQDLGFESCTCCDFVGKVAKSSKSKRKAKRNNFCDAFVGSK